MRYKQINGQLVPPPVNYRTPEGTTIMNFNLSPAKMDQYGWPQWSDSAVNVWNKEHPQQNPTPDTTDFDNVCAQFREICAQIGQAIDQPGFKGGFDQMSLFAQSPVYSTIQGLKLGIAWAAANEACQHQAAKLGLYRPGDATWWRLCWAQESDSK